MIGETHAHYRITERIGVGGMGMRDLRAALVLDDVLVNFDAGRVRRTAAVLGRFADRHQVLFFTCHPATADQLRAIADVSDKYRVPEMKVTGGQRIDLFGIKKEDLPAVWAELGKAGFVSGFAYAKGLRTVKTCVGTDWCRFGTQPAASARPGWKRAFSVWREPGRPRWPGLRRRAPATACCRLLLNCCWSWGRKNFIPSPRWILCSSRYSSILRDQFKTVSNYCGTWYAPLSVQEEKHSPTILLHRCRPMFSDRWKNLRRDR